VNLYLENPFVTGCDPREHWGGKRSSKGGRSDHTEGNISMAKGSYKQTVIRGHRKMMGEKNRKGGGRQISATDPPLTKDDRGPNFVQIALDGRRRTRRIRGERQGW